ncbi:MAG: hypothetical protein ACFFEY_14940 [Candidatus Thorarchaeota archaeon]
MKILCYLILIVAFMMYYQKNPVYTIIIIAIGIGIYIFFKSRKGKGGFFNKFLGFKPKNETDERMDDLITLFMLQQMFNNSIQNKSQVLVKETPNNDSREKLEKEKQEILELLEHD